jgi:Protein of unknown function (DUF2786)
MLNRLEFVEIHMDADLNKIKDRIRKLLATATHKGGGTAQENAISEMERDMAMRMAMNLMVQHGIEQSELGGEASKVKMGTHASKIFVKYRQDLATAAATLYGCRAIFYQKGKSGFRFIGRTDNIEAAEETLLWFVRQLDRLYKEQVAIDKNIPTRGSECYQFRERFKEAAARRVWDRSVQLIRDSEQIAQATGQNALVVQGYFKTLDEESSAFLRENNIGVMKTKPIRVAAGTREGLAAGDRVKLRQEVNR